MRRKDIFTQKIKMILQEVFGIEMSLALPHLSFIEIGMDSLLLMEFAQKVRNRFGFPVTLRQLIEEYDTPERIAVFLDKNLPEESIVAVAEIETCRNNVVVAAEADLLTLAGGKGLGRDTYIKEIEYKHSGVLGQGWKYRSHRKARSVPEIPDLIQGKIQEHFIVQLMHRYSQRFIRSWHYVQAHFPEIAERYSNTKSALIPRNLLCPIVIGRAEGSKVTDIDKNEYIDAANGFGSNVFGYHSSDYAAVKTYNKDQVASGELAAGLSRTICELSGFETSKLFSSCRQALNFALHAAKAKTGRSLVVSFGGSLHHFSEDPQPNEPYWPAITPGIQGRQIGTYPGMIVLKYGTIESLEFIRENATKIAAVLVEPVQGLWPEKRPVEFLRQLRKVSFISTSVLIFDESFSGFRMSPGGVQQLFGVRPDLCIYSVGTGANYPIAAVAGNRSLIEQDEKVTATKIDHINCNCNLSGLPELAWHLSLVGARTGFQRLQREQNLIYHTLARKTRKLEFSLNEAFQNQCLPFYVSSFGSLWVVKSSDSSPRKKLLFTLLREKGIYIFEEYPSYISASHTDNDIQLIIKSFIESINELMQAGFYQNDSPIISFGTSVLTNQAPPMEGARLGKDVNGNPGWFIADSGEAGSFFQIKLI